MCVACLGNYNVPFDIRKSGRGWKVGKKGSSKTFSRQPLSKTRAKAQLAALYANESWPARLMRQLDEATAENIKPPVSAREIADKHKVSLSDVERALDMGEEVELEHTTDRETARQIASHHVFELIDYYEKLAGVEEALGARLLIGSVSRDFAVRSRVFRIEQYSDEELKSLTHERLRMGNDDFLWRFRTDCPEAVYWWTVPVDDDYIDVVRNYITTKTGITPTKNIDLEHVSSARKWSHGIDEKLSEKLLKRWGT